MLRAVIVMAAILPGCSHFPGRPFESFVDAGGCRIERVSDAGDDDGNFQFHGPSDGDRYMVVGAYKGAAKSAFLLDLADGSRRPLPNLTNAGAISADGNSALVATDTSDAKTEIVEVDLRTLEAVRVVSDPSHDFLATYSPDGARILFNSYRTGDSDIYDLERSSGLTTRLTEYAGYDAHADYSPDMSVVLFHRDLGEGD